MTRWEKSTSFVRDLSEWAKLLALLLAVIGFLTVYFPGLKRAWEVHLQPASWYYIGYSEAGRFRPFAYQHPLWNDGPAPETALARIPGQVIVTMNDELHIGRTSPGVAGAVRTVVGKDACLAVSQVKEIQAQGGVRRFVWADAVKVTC